MSKLAKFRRMRRRILRQKQTRTALLGDGNGNVDAPGIGKYYVRLLTGGMDANGNVTGGISTIANAGLVDHPTYDGARVELKYNKWDELEIVGGDTRDMRNAKIDPKIANRFRPENAFIYLRNVVRLMSRAVGTTSSPSTLVSIWPLVYDDNYGSLNRYIGTPLQADKVDLASYIPTSGNHRYAVLFLDTTDDSIQVATSTTQAMTTPLDLSDLQEAFATRRAETIPIQAYKLANGATGITMLDIGEDLRQFINMPQANGFSSPVADNQIIRAGRTVTHAGSLEVTGSLNVEGSLIQVDDPPAISKASATIGSKENKIVIEEDGDTYWDGTGGLIRGNMNIAGAADIIVEITDGNPTEVFDDGTTSAGDGWEAGILNRVTFPTGGDEHYLTVTIPGSYTVNWSMSFNMPTPGANIEVHGGIMVDGVAVRNAGEGHRTIANNSDTGNMAHNTEIDCPNGTEQISLWVLNAQNNQDITVEHSDVHIELVGGT